MTPDIQLTKEELNQRADNAERLMQDPLMQEAFANLRIQYFEEWMDTQPDDARGREALYMAARAVSHVENHLRVVASRRSIEGRMETLKKVQSVRRETLRRDIPGRAGNTVAPADVLA
jgi:hypothetical protein